MADFDHPLHAATPTGGDSRIDMDFVGTLYQAAQRGRGVIIFMYLHEARSLTARKSTSGAARRSWCNMPTSVATSTWRARVVRRFEHAAGGQDLYPLGWECSFAGEV